MTSQSTHVIFGTGPLGQSVMRALLAQGETVRMVNRSGHAELPQQVELVAGDASNPSQARDLAADAKVVYQCAMPPYDQWPDLFPALHGAILDAAAAANAVFVFGDNLYMYGDTNGAPLHEGLPYNAQTRKGRVRAELAEATLQAHADGRVRAVLARGADFFGPGVTGSTLGERIFEPVLQGKTAQAMGDIDQPHTYTYINDFGEAMLRLGEHESAWGRAWHVPNAPTKTTREVIEMIFKKAGQEPKIGSMGKLMLRMGGLFMSDARESVEMFYQFEKPFIVKHDEYAATFGDHATAWDVSIAETLDWYRQRMGASAGVR